MITIPGKARQWVESKLSLHLSLNSHFTNRFIFPLRIKREEQERRMLEIHRRTVALLSVDHGNENASPTHTPCQSWAKYPGTAT